IKVGGGVVDASEHVPDGGDGGLLVGGDQVQVAGVVVASAAVSGAVGARGGGAGAPVGDRVFECLQVLEPALRNGTGITTVSLGRALSDARVVAGRVLAAGDGVRHRQRSAGVAGWWCRATLRAALAGAVPLPWPAGGGGAARRGRGPGGCRGRADGRRRGRAGATGLRYLPPRPTDSRRGGLRRGR